jgi:transaldolase / glucose-6-phosphate isomerase
VFIQVVADGDEDVEIPGEEYSFKVLKHAQAIGDYKTLEAHDLPVARVNSIKEIL